MIIRTLGNQIEPGRGYGEKKGRGEPSKAPEPRQKGKAYNPSREKHGMGCPQDYQQKKCKRD